MREWINLRDLAHLIKISDSEAPPFETPFFSVPEEGLEELEEFEGLEGLEGLEDNPTRKALVPSLETSKGSCVRAAAVSEWTRGVFEDEPTRAMADSVWIHGLRPALIDHHVLRAASADMHLFSHELQPKRKATDQGASGRCWGFAGLNLLRRQLSSDPDFQLSGSYLLFYDKLERVNGSLRHIGRERTRALREVGGKHGSGNPYDSRRIQHILENAVVDGGDWHIFASLVTKYGVVPESAMPETPSAYHTRTF